MISKTALVSIALIRRIFEHKNITVIILCQLCQIILCMVTNKTVEKNVVFRYFDVLFLKYSDWKKKKNQRNWMSYPKNMLFLFRKKYFSAICLFLEWILSKKYSQNSIKTMLTISWEFESSQSINAFLERHFTQACIYYSVIQSKTFLSVLGLKKLIPFHSKVKQLQIHSTSKLLEYQV